MSVYYSKKDAWLVGLVVVAILTPLLIGVFLFFATAGSWVAGATPLIAVVIEVLVLLLAYPLYYEITPSALIIRCGMLVRQQIPLDSIREVFPTRNPLSAPAWSIDRLRINYDGGYALISPKDKVRFMQELASSGAGLEMRDGRVVRD